MARKGIIGVGNWIVDSVKFITVYPQKGNLTKIVGQDQGLGGCAHNVLADLASLKSGLPLYAGGCIGDDQYGRMCLDAAWVLTAPTSRPSPARPLPIPM